MQRSPLAIVGKQEPESDHLALAKLPAPPTPLIGREHEVAQARQLLERDDVRLVSVTGPGGVGKTRLALDVAAGLADLFPDRVDFVSLAPITDPALVAATIAQTLDVKETGGSSLLDTLKAHLRSRRMLLLLDNFEQVAAAAPLVADLLAAAPGLKILVTTRSILHIRGEYELPLLPLTLPGKGRSVRLDDLAHNPAVALFVQRASAVKPDFALTPANAATVAEICARLDGLPLAIELAAARIKLLSLPALLARLADRLRLLTGGAQDLPARQQTLRNTLDWSYDLLSPEEQHLFRCLSVFVGGCTLAAAEAVAADVPLPAESFLSGDAVGATDILEHIGSLSDKSLLWQSSGAGGEVRFWMLETVRSYALECLEASGEDEEMHRRHAAYCLALVNAADANLSGPEQTAWLTRLEEEHDNLRAALTWSLHSDGAYTALRLEHVLWRFWDVHGHLSEGRRWMEESLAVGHDQPDALRADVLHGLSRLTWVQGDYIQTQQRVEESLALWRKLGSVEGIARELHILGIIMGPLHLPDQARAYLEESLDLWRKLGHKGNIARLLNSLALAARSQGDYQHAQALIYESLDLHRAIGNQRGISTALANLGIVAHGMGDDTSALRFLAESLQLRRELGHRAGVIDCLVGFAGAYGGLGQGHRAARLLSAVAALCDELGFSLDPEDQLVYNRELALARNRLGDAAFTQDWQDGQQLTLEQAVEEALAPLTAPESAPEALGTPTAVPLLDEEEFSAAVQEALRTYTQAGALQRNPLLESRLIIARTPPQASSAQRVVALQGVIQEVCTRLQEVPRDVKFYRAVQHTYLRPAGTQEQVSELLDLPFSTFRRHLKEGVHRVTETLWQWELEQRAANGAPAPR